MNNTLKELDRVLAFIIKQDKKGLETYWEEVVDLLKAHKIEYVHEILKRLTVLGYIVLSKETDNYKPTLDGLVFFENSEGKPFQEKGTLGSDNEFLHLIKDEKTKPYLFFLLVFVLFASFWFYKMKITNKRLEHIEAINIETKRLIDSLEVVNAKLNEEMKEKEIQLKKSINWSAFRINKLKKELDQLKNQVHLTSEDYRISFTEFPD